MRLGDAGVILGLVSGAMEGAARTKLMPANLNRFFLFGAYGSDSPDRNELTRVAIEKAARLHAGLSPHDVFVVGDTPLDIAAGRAIGAVTVAVDTGRRRGGLAAHGPDHLFDDLGQTGDLSEVYPVAGFHKTLEGRNGGGDPWHTDGDLYVGVIREGIARPAP